MKKIAMIVPSLLLTGCLFGCGNKEADPFIITSEEKFNEAINFKGVKHLQAARVAVNYTYVQTTTYAESYMSPNVYYEFDRFSYDRPGTPDQKYVEKTQDDKYYIYTPQEGKEKWKQDVTAEQDFRTPQKEGEFVKGILQLGSVDYNLIKDKYDKERQAYYFKTHNESGVDYDTVMSFYNNRLIYFSYCHYNEDKGYTELTIFSYTYGTINPTLPPYDPIEP